MPDSTAPLYHSHNKAARFVPVEENLLDDDIALPAVEVAGVLVFVYVNTDGHLRVSVDLDTADPLVFPAEGVPMTIAVQGQEVYKAGTVDS